MVQNYILETHLPTSDTREHRNFRRSVKFRKDKPKVAFISPQVISAKNQMRKCAPPSWFSGLSSGFRRKRLR